MPVKDSLIRSFARLFGWMPRAELDRFQPMPIGLQIAPAGTTKHPKTAIARSWREGDPARCRLCPTCFANPTNFCVVVTPGIVAPKDAALFRLTPDMLAPGPARR
jgi:hypothetical protein